MSYMFYKPQKVFAVKQLLAAVSLLGFSSPALADTNCTAQPSCENLGYSQLIRSDCPEENILYCPFDLSYKKCIAPSCENLGFTQDDKSTWCDKIIKCKYDESYSLCLTTNVCPSGYDTQISDVSLCGNMGATGWVLDSVTVTRANGASLVCTKCNKKSCSGSPNYTSIADCGTSTDGWTFSTCYYGDEKHGVCNAKSCLSYGYKTSSSLCTSGIYKSVSVKSGNSYKSCYQCGACVAMSLETACRRCPSGRAMGITPTTPTGYQGSCKNLSYRCCSATEQCRLYCPTNIPGIIS